MLTAFNRGAQEEPCGIFFTQILLKSLTRSFKLNKELMFRGLSPIGGFQNNRSFINVYPKYRLGAKLVGIWLVD